MKTIRNNVFETNSSSMHSFCISNNKPSITQFNDLHMKIDASGEYGWGPGEVSTPEEKLNYAIVAMLIVCVDKLDGEKPDENEKQVVRFAKGAKLLERVRKYLSDIEWTFKSHGVYIEWADNLFTIDPDTRWYVQIMHDGYIDHQSDPNNDYESKQIADWAMNDPESLFNFCFNDSCITLDNDNH